MKQTLEIPLESLVKFPLTPVDVLILSLIYNELDPYELTWGEGIDLDSILTSLENNLYIKRTEFGYELRNKGKEVFEGEEMDNKINEILEYLNTSTNRRFSLKSNSNRRFVAGRLKEGYSVEDLKAVVDTMVEKWGNDSKMSFYLRPETLFNATKFQTYINLTKRDKEDEDWRLTKI